MIPSNARGLSSRLPGAPSTNCIVDFLCLPRSTRVACFHLGGNSFRTSNVERGGDGNGDMRLGLRATMRIRTYMNESAAFPTFENVSATSPSVQSRRLKWPPKQYQRR